MLAAAFEVTGVERYRLSVHQRVWKIPSRSPVKVCVGVYTLAMCVKSRIQTLAAICWVFAPNLMKGEKLLLPSEVTTAMVNKVCFCPTTMLYIIMHNQVDRVLMSTIVAAYSILR